MKNNRRRRGLAEKGNGGKAIAKCPNHKVSRHIDHGGEGEVKAPPRRFEFDKIIHVYKRFFTDDYVKGVRGSPKWRTWRKGERGFRIPPVAKIIWDRILRPKCGWDK